MADDKCAFGLVCYLCKKSKMPDGEVMMRMDCCRASVHRSCLTKHYPGLVNDKTVPCLKCRKVDAKASIRVVQNKEFTVEQVDLIERCFIKHHSCARIPLTQKEMQGLETARCIQGPRAMRQVSYRIFMVGMSFWFPVPKQNVCEWVDVVSRLSMGLIWINISEMRSRFEVRVQAEKKGDAFHHFLEYLAEVVYEQESVKQASIVVSSCGQTDCEECNGFVSVFERDRHTFKVALGNRPFLYDQVDLKQFREFMKYYHQKQRLDQRC